MKKALLIVFILVFATGLFAQDSWGLTWRQTVNPFQPAMSGSEMGFVVGGFDTDGDGKGEFICSTSDFDSSYVQMYEANGDNTYDLVWSWLNPLPSNTFYKAAVGDLDGNGTVELVISTPTVADGTNPPRIRVFEWSGVTGENKYGDYSGGDDPEPHSTWNMGVEANIDIRPYSLVIEDIDGDAKNELIIGVRSGDGGRGVTVASVTGTFATLTFWTAEYEVTGWGGGSLYSVTTGDLDGDGLREIHAVMWNMLSVKFIEATAANTYSLETELDTIYQQSGIDHGSLDGVVVGDVDGDGNNEMYIASMESVNHLIIVQDVTDLSAIVPADFVTFYEIPKVGSGTLRTMQMADPDGDGNMSLIIAGHYSGQIYDLEYNGSGDPADDANWTLTIAFDVYDLAAAELGADSAASLSPRFFYGDYCGDMDGDGKPEYAFVNYSTDFGVWENDAYLWIIEFGPTVGIAYGNTAGPTNMRLSDNYPNPFNPTTKLDFELDEAGTVVIRIYDVTGAEVAEIVNDHRPAGSYTATFDATNLASGMYIATMNVNGVQLTRSMMLIK